MKTTTKFKEKKSCNIINNNNKKTFGREAGK